MNIYDCLPFVKATSQSDSDVWLIIFFSQHKTKSVYEFLIVSRARRMSHSIYVFASTTSLHRLQNESVKLRTATACDGQQRYQETSFININVHQSHGIGNGSCLKSKNQILQIIEPNGKWSIRMWVIAQSQRLSLSLYLVTRFHEITCARNNKLCAPAKATRSRLKVHRVFIRKMPTIRRKMKN